MKLLEYESFSELFVRNEIPAYKKTEFHGFRLQIKKNRGYIMKKFDFKDTKEKLTEGFLSAAEVAKKAIA